MHSHNKFGNFQDIALAAVGPLSNLPELSWFRSETCSDDEFTRRIFF
jgi:mitochondrial-processing peptidase subunit beta